MYIDIYTYMIIQHSLTNFSLTRVFPSSMSSDTSCYEMVEVMKHHLKNQVTLINSRFWLLKSWRHSFVLPVLPAV